MINDSSREFFKKFSKVWQNLRDYTYLKGIDLSEKQIEIIEQEEDQLLIEGYAGTGKSITLLYKFINTMIKEESQRILFVTFNKTLIDDTKKRLSGCKEFIENKKKHDIKILTFHEMASEILKDIKVIERDAGKLTIETIKKDRDTTFRYISAILYKFKEITSDEYKLLKKDERLYKTHDEAFVRDEIAWIKSMGFTKRDIYLEKDRIGRSKSIRLTRAQRNTIFKIYEVYEQQKRDRYHNKLDLEDYALRLLENMDIIGGNKRFDYIFVDEVQDLDPMQISALCMLAKKSIVLSGDAKQRIYKKTPLKYEDMGLKIKEKGKRRTLNKNYRSTEQIIRLANSLEFMDSHEKLTEKHFVKQGEKPIIQRFTDNLKAIKYIANEIKKIYSENEYKTIAIINREDIKNRTSYGKSAFRLKLEEELLMSISDIKTYESRFNMNNAKQIFYTNAYDVKGLEFDIVFIVDFNKYYYPNAKDIEKIKVENEDKDEALIKDDILDVINTEKKLLYVAMTRAKEKLYLICNNCKDEKDVSSFIYDFNMEDYTTNMTKSIIKKNMNYYEYFFNRFSNSIDNKKPIIDTENNKNNIDISSKDDNIIIEEYVKPYFSQLGIKIKDNRDKGGALWVLGGKELDNIMKYISSKGIDFTYSQTGGKAFKGKESWYFTKSRLRK